MICVSGMGAQKTTGETHKRGMIEKQNHTARTHRGRNLTHTGLRMLAALSAAFLVPQVTFGHGEEDAEGHDDYLESLPLGQIGLLPDDATYPVLHGQVGALLP